MPDTTEVLVPLNFGTLKSTVKSILDRGGDSATSDTLAGMWVNAAEKFICSEIGAPHFLQYEDSFTLAASDNTETLPVNVKEVTSVYDKANLHQLVYVAKEKWNAFITDATNGTGTPGAWTKWGYTRRTNTESPSAEYGQLQLAVWPTPRSSVTLSYDCILRPGCMVFDSDMPVVPIEYHYGLIQMALMNAGPYDIGVKAFQQNSQLAMMWLRSIIRSERREMQGNQKFIHVAEWRRRAGARANPLTRYDQLYGARS